MIWRVGNGESVWIKVDHWLPNQACCSVISPLPQLANDTRVSFLIDQDRFAWKESVVKELFLPHEADIILGIPLSFWHPPDRIAWAQTPTGMFSTSSAYKLIVSGASTSIAGSSNLDNQGNFGRACGNSGFLIKSSFSCGGPIMMLCQLWKICIDGILLHLIGVISVKSSLRMLCMLFGCARTS